MIDCCGTGISVAERLLRAARCAKLHTASARSMPMSPSIAGSEKASSITEGFETCS